MSTPRVHAVVLILCLSIFSAGCTGSPSGELVVKVIEDVPPGAEVNKVGPSEIIEKEEFDKVVNGTHANFTTREDSSVIVRGGIVKVDSVEEMKDFVDSIPKSSPNAEEYPEGHYFIYKNIPMVIEFATIQDSG